MKRSLTILLSMYSFLALAQSESAVLYHDFTELAEELYQNKYFEAAADLYAEAFKVNGNRGQVNHRYKAASAYAISQRPDSAFLHLFRIATRGNYKDYDRLLNDTSLVRLHSLKRWSELCNLVKSNKERAEAKLNKPLMEILDVIYEEDQKYRGQSQELEKQYGKDSKELTAHYKLIEITDSLNLQKVTILLETHGWLGQDEVGINGSTALWLVIQHSKLEIQLKYLPMMREAVKNGILGASELAYTEDRVLLGQKKKQLYGSQIYRDPETGAYDVAPLEDPYNVDQRRAQVGLGPLAEYTKIYNFKWDASEYVKRLPELIKKYW